MVIAIGFIFLFTLTVAALTVSVSVNLRYGEMLMNVEDNLESCVDVIDERFKGIARVLGESPGVVDDDPFVRSFMDEVKGARNDLLLIANLISRATERTDEINSETEESLALMESNEESETQQT